MISLHEFEPSRRDVMMGSAVTVSAVVMPIERVFAAATAPRQRAASSTKTARGAPAGRPVIPASPAS
jgi:hypothetical protein